MGSEADNRPAYVVMPDSHGAQEEGVPMYTIGFLPSVYQPTMFRPGSKPVLNLDLPRCISLDERRRSIAVLHDLNRGAMAGPMVGEEPEFAARMSAYDTAFKM